MDARTAVELVLKAHTQNKVILSVNVKDENSVDVDPDTLKITVRDPGDALGAGEDFDYPAGTEITKTSLGNFKMTFTGVIAGLHNYRVLTTNPDGSEEGKFEIKISNVVA